MQDLSFFYASLNLPSHPLSKRIEWPIASEHQHSISRIDVDQLTPEIKNILEDLNIKISWVGLWTWNKPQSVNSYPVHTDMNDKSLNLSRYSINWHISGKSYVEWVSTINLKKRWSYAGISPSTVYEAENIDPLIAWHGGYPALIDISKPHRVTFDNNKPRRSLTIRLDDSSNPTSILEKFKDYIVAVNSE